jgi:hypothetical protein
MWWPDTWNQPLDDLKRYDWLALVLGIIWLWDIKGTQYNQALHGFSIAKLPGRGSGR